MRRCRPTFVLPGPNPGLRIKGNIDICNRPKVWDKRTGRYSTVRSISVGTDRGEAVIPTVLTNPPRIVGDRAAIRNYERTGQHLGIFNTVHNAEKYADRLHEQQARIYGE